LHWRPGKTAAHLAQGHTPEVCLTAVGRELVSASELDWIESHGLRLPFRSYAIANCEPPVFVFYCLWDDRKGSRPFKTVALTYTDRLQLALAGQRNPGQ